jgi:serine/threonine-protein kinase
MSATLPGDAFEAMQPQKQEFPVRAWSRYEFLSLLGQGGMGTVYKARDKRLGRIVALKFVHSSVPQMTMRFIQEARAQSRINHSGICKVYEVGEVEGKAFIAMQFVDGQTIDKLAPSLTLHDKVLLVRAVSEAIHAAHRLGIIHRDIKPSNVVSRWEEAVWVPQARRSKWRKCRTLTALC